jgi:chromosome segregation ATPase
VVIDRPPGRSAETGPEPATDERRLAELKGQLEKAQAEYDDAVGAQIAANAEFKKTSEDVPHWALGQYERAMTATDQRLAAASRALVDAKRRYNEVRQEYGQLLAEQHDGDHPDPLTTPAERRVTERRRILAEDLKALGIDVPNPPEGAG